MTLRVGVDLDGVLADMEGALAHHAAIMFGVPHSAPAPGGDQSPGGPTPLLALSQRKRLWRHVQAVDGFWETLQEIEPGTVAQLALLAAERRWEVIFLTKRSATAGATAQVQSQRWLEARGFPLPSVYVVAGSRGKIAAALSLDVVVDDRPENCLDVVADSKARAIGIFRDAQRSLPGSFSHLGIQVVPSTSDCLKLLRDIDSGFPRRPRRFARLLKVLGLRPSGV